MHSRLLELRVWLEQKGLYPTGKLAFITGYLLALEALLFVLQKTAGAFYRPLRSSLGGWIFFLGLVAIALLLVLAGRFVSSRLLWRMRNRLLVTYVFIGVVPLLLLAGLAGLGFYLFAGQFATYIVTSRLRSQLESLQASNIVIARELANSLDRERTPQMLGDQESRAWNDRQFSAWLDGKLLFDRPVPGLKAAAPFLPSFLPARFPCVVRDQGQLSLSSAETVSSRAGKLVVVSSRPLDPAALLDLSSNLGQITLYASGFKLRQTNQRPFPGVCTPAEATTPEITAGEPTFTVGSVPPPARVLDGAVNFPTAIYVVNWRDGDPSEPAGIAVQTRLSRLLGHLFSSLGYFAPTIELFVVLAAILLVITEGIAWWIGTRLTRSVTGAVAQIYLATTHINRGDFSHRIPISSADQLAALAASFNLMTESLERLMQEQKEKQRLQNEITIAQEVQAQLFPRRITQLPSLEVHGFCRPARSVSGDYYDFLHLGSERLILAVGDVSGKGISAALLMATIHSAVRAYAMEGIPVFRQAQAVGAGRATALKYDPVVPGAEASPGTLLSLLNHQLYHTTPMEKYATLFLAAYDGDDRRLTFSNAGHLPPLLLGESGSIRRLEHGGTVVGLFEEVTYDEGSVQLRPGDIFLAYSDGVTEPENDFGEFGEQRLIELVQENRHLPLSRITELVTAAVDDWIGAAEQPDDVTLVLARAR